MLNLFQLGLKVITNGSERRAALAPYGMFVGFVPVKIG